MHTTKTHTTRNQPNINVTPLIDVLLVLLIIFMVISPQRPRRFTAQIPEKPALEPPDFIHECDFCLLVTVKAEGGYALNQRPAATLGDLSDTLHRALDGRPLDRKTVFLKAPPSLAYGKVAQVIDVMKAAGSAPIGLQRSVEAFRFGEYRFQQDRHAVDDALPDVSFRRSCNAP